MWSPRLFLTAIHSARRSSRKFMAAPVRSASWLGLSIGAAGATRKRGLSMRSSMRLALCPRRQNHLRTLHIALHSSVEGEHLTWRLCVPGSARVRVWTSEGSENSVPEKVDHREIAVAVQMVDKVKLLLAPEPSEACEHRSFGVVLLVKIYVRGE